jgi:hypothetical protein
VFVHIFFVIEQLMKSPSVIRFGVLFVLGGSLLVSTGCDMRRVASEATESAAEMLKNCSDENTDEVWENASEGFHDLLDSEEDLARSCHTLLLQLGEFESITKVNSVSRQKDMDEDRMTLGLLVEYEVGEVEVTYVAVREDGEWRLRGYDFGVEDVEPMDPDMDELRELADEQSLRLVEGEFEDFVNSGLSFRTAMTVEQMTTGMQNLLQAQGALTAATFTEVTLSADESAWTVTYDLQFANNSGRLRLGYEWAGAGWEFLHFDAQPRTENGAAPNGARIGNVPNGAPVPNGKP